MKNKSRFLHGQSIQPPAIDGNISIVDLVDQTFNAYNAARFREACHLFTERMQMMPQAVPQLLIGLDFALEEPKRVVITGPNQKQLLTSIHQVYQPNKVVMGTEGTVEPFANVAVKTRVDGQIVEVLFKEGDLVKEGDLLFRLDDRLVKAMIAQAEASIAKDQASLRDAEATLARRAALIDRKIVTEASMDQARFAVEGLGLTDNQRLYRFHIFQDREDIHVMF